MNVDRAILACLKELNKESLPENIEFKYIDMVDFFKLKEKGIPEELTRSLPVLTLQENDKNMIYVNYHALAQNEYYTLELIVSQLTKIILKDMPKYKKLESQQLDSFLCKYASYGLSILIEYKELENVFKVMEKLYNSKEYTYQKSNPYTMKQNKKIALGILRRTFASDNVLAKSSSITYGMARLALHTDYDYENLFDNKQVSTGLNKLKVLLRDTSLDAVNKQTLNSIGTTLKNIVPIKIPLPEIPQKEEEPS